MNKKNEETDQKYWEIIGIVNMLRMVQLRKI